MMNGVSSQWANSPRLGLIGNPENRRVRDFQKAVEELGLSKPPCLSYEELLRDPESLSRLEVDLLRIDCRGRTARSRAHLLLAVADLRMRTWNSVR